MKFSILLLFCASVSVLFAADNSQSHQAVATKLYELLSPRDIFIQSFSEIYDAQLEQMARMGVPDNKLDELKQAGLAFAKRIADDPQLEARMIKAYQETFTQQEIEDLIAFYQTETGKKALTELPQLFREGSKIGQELAQKYQDDFQKEVSAILQPEDEAAPGQETEPDTKQ